MLNRLVEGPFWNTWGVLIGRLIIAAVFIMALTFKLMDSAGTASYIAAAGFPAAVLLTWLAVALEIALAFAFVTGAYFRLASFVAMFYVLFLGFAFHGPSHWQGNQMEFGFFVDHFTFAAGLIFMVAHGPGTMWTLDRGSSRSPSGERAA